MKKRKMNKPISKGVAKNTPVVMQLEFLECGAASLAMILAYYGKWLPLEQVRYDCGVSRDGSSAKNMYKAAVNYGLDCKAYKLELDEIKNEATFPCIIHWNFNHFVVLKGFKGNYAYINDPGRGDVRVPLKEFDDSFTGVCLMFEPTENFVPFGKKKSTFDFIKEKIKGLGPLVFFGIFFTVIASVISLITPAFTRVFYDRLLSKTNTEWATPFLILFSIVSGIQIIVVLMNTLYNLRIGGKFDVVGQSAYVWKVLRLPMQFFQQRMAGDIISRKLSNATVSRQIVNILSPLIINGFMMIFYFIIMIKYSLPLTIIALVTSIVNFVFSRLITKKRMNATRIQLRDSAKLSAVTMNGIEMIEPIKASGAEDGYFSRWAGYQASNNAASADFMRTSQLYSIAPQVVSSICSMTIVGIGIYLTMQGQFTLGMISAFQGYLGNFLAPATTFIESGNQLQEMQTSIERLDDVMKYPLDPAFERNVKVESYGKLSGNVELKNISFGYSRLADPLIKDFSISIKRGSRVAFVGTSGCGKSTLANLISGIYKPWSGTITFDGKSLDEIDRSIFTSSVAVVDQDIIIFEDTIRNNIKMWDDSIEDYEMILAARDAQIHEDILQRKDGYDHVMCEGGKDFSGGQRQRLEIARVLAQDPTICILDEATSALDAKTEYDVVKAIKDRGITCIVIAHRLSTIRDCDEIVVLDKGDVVERGTHEQLMKNNGFYAKLVNSD